ncbi:DNA-binding response regulator [Malaciobacter mytili LMG 24559]|uniref:DNA-binding response regulator n=1 Tax=Malaciobacter mytili LMG 24559 TaxID=1032238 RepID=A0AAX2ADD5_9BACT|nr:response regulator transcription factor [Malaciobacter mytili]AXH14271.1 two-component system response regulator [Malaciobacter mytili LMG 24559]RXK13861.1 DNA-binding response regulator [Malaciobacter mytili LMG 24559]
MNNEFKNLTILYAEDNLIIQENISKILKLLFSKVYIASNGKEALELFKRYTPNIILTDFIMPIFDGYELTCEIRKVCYKVPIVILSNYTDKEKLLKCIPLNLTQYLEKPIEYNKLIDTLHLCKNHLEKNNFLRFTISNKLTYDFQTKKLFIDNKEIYLTHIEIEIFEYFINKKNQIITKDELAIIIYEDKYINENALKNVIYRLRKKIGKDLIKNDRNLGYSLKVENQ